MQSSFTVTITLLFKNYRLLYKSYRLHLTCDFIFRSIIFKCKLTLFIQILDCCFTQTELNSANEQDQKLVSMFCCCENINLMPVTAVLFTAEFRSKANIFIKQHADAYCSQSSKDNQGCQQSWLYSACTLVHISLLTDGLHLNLLRAVFNNNKKKSIHPFFH